MNNLHKCEFSRKVSKNDAYIARVREAYNLEKDADIKNKDVSENIVTQITLADVKTAIHRCRVILKQKLPTDARNICGVTCYDNPDFSIHEFISAVLYECGESPE